MGSSTVTKEERKFAWLFFYGPFVFAAEMILLWSFNEKCFELFQIVLWFGMGALCIHIWLKRIAHWFVGCCVRELSYLFCIRCIQKRQKLFEKSGDIDNRWSTEQTKVFLYWFNGDIDEASSLWVQLPPEGKINKKRGRNIILPDGWIAFRTGDEETLECLWQECSKKDETFRQIFKSWQAILQKDWSFEWKPLKVTGIRGMDVHNAYWAGFWYMASGNREAAIEKFLYVWRWGDRTELAEKARYALEGWSVELPPQEPVIRNGYKKACALLILFFIFSGVLYVLLANLFGGYVPRIG